MDALSQRLISFYALIPSCELSADGSPAAQIDFIVSKRGHLILLSPFGGGLKSWRCCRTE